MQKLAEICVKRPVFAVVLILILVVVGSVGFTRLGVDRLPAVENPTITVSTDYPGASPEAVETEITDKIEENVNTIAGINELNSTSSEGNSRVTISFNLDKDADVATQEVRDKVNLAQRRLPDDVEAPIVRKQDPNSSPVLGFAISGRGSVKQITEYVDKIFRPQIESADGVGEVILAGGQLRQINIIPDPYKLRGYGLSVTDLIGALQKGNVEVPGGDVEAGQQTLTLRTQGRLTSLRGFERLIVANQGENSGSVRLSDVARVEDGVETATRTAELNGKPTDADLHSQTIGRQHLDHDRKRHQSAHDRGASAICPPVTTRKSCATNRNIFEAAVRCRRRTFGRRFDFGDFSGTDISAQLARHR